MRLSKFFGAAVVVSTLALVGAPAGAALADGGDTGQATTTTVSCDPSSLVVNTSTTCTATVAAPDSSSSRSGESIGGGSASGVVDWSSEGLGTLNPGPECAVVDGSSVDTIVV